MSAPNPAVHRELRATFAVHPPNVPNGIYAPGKIGLWDNLTGAESHVCVLQ